VPQGNDFTTFNIPTTTLSTQTPHLQNFQISLTAAFGYRLPYVTQQRCPN